MKKNLLLTGLTAVAMFFASCSDDDTSQINITNGGDGGNGNQDNVIGGTLSEDLTLTANETYTLSSALIVPTGRTLTINEGVVVKANAGSDVYIAVQQGATINASGSASNPIVLTSNVATPNAGDWGGLIILGRAPINSVAGGDATSTSEIGNLPYGGSIENDNSGTLRYVRVEYSGGSADASSENNGFSFYGVGSGTTIEYIQAFEGKDDGVEFFGGTVNASFISVVGAQDDSVDWTEGYTGSLTNVYVRHGVDHDKGIEGDGFNTDIGNNSDSGFFSAPNITNITIVGRGSSNENEAIRLRAGTRALFTNVELSGFAEAFDLDDEDGENITGSGVTANETGVTDILFTDVTLRLKNDTGAEFTEDDFFSGIDNGTGTDYDTWSAGWVRN
ncbi:hypothetical protein [Croceibacter atlanticus]|jgi:hypothetical protein|uniref:Multidrug transporter n=1 Tax=Croceibacter atlanticus (strain ATCC BAA-628 / JCM 21780 / CIP 108009 / IAM 15332 / KCTC 12090 / HTCC2559) TaxID=216432 RepID=A3U5D6_CROAH|nr:hypothetical protein [Croceibacter atlanticus]EAP87453.1 hypothetical protein CA2559_01820 [Croceibacter atlanticus HTCC2559]MBW4970313.1 multidrug transporter [Croceibacter atlanticus]WSP35125.1 multidrug transporter [Croceibacter atlanticus]HAT69904.1 multidrug transporter [Flavobacteriaceae bacterium]|tara:strand:- start:396 stop:1568 length:1173 start_codon:yes stop_codon:yes gene_type:complete